MPHKIPTQVTHGPLKGTNLSDLSDGELVWLRCMRQEELDGIVNGERICYAPWDNNAYYEQPYSFLREHNPRLYRWVVDDATFNLKAYDFEIERRDEERLKREREQERQQQREAQQLLETADPGPWPPPAKKPAHGAVRPDRRCLGIDVFLRKDHAGGH
jgi:hypothetical protein